MNCPQCSHPTRPMHMKAHEAPGTRQRCGDGLCKNCYYHNRKNDPILTPEQLQNARNALNGYLKARQNRITRSKGAPTWQSTTRAETTPTWGQAPNHSGSAKRTITQDAHALRGATTRATRNQQTQTAHNMDSERSALELQM